MRRLITRLDCAKPASPHFPFASARARIVEESATSEATDGTGVGLLLAFLGWCQLHIWAGGADEFAAKTGSSSAVAQGSGN